MVKTKACRALSGMIFFFFFVLLAAFQPTFGQGMGKIATQHAYSVLDYMLSEGFALPQREAKIRASQSLRFEEGTLESSRDYQRELASDLAGDLWINFKLHGHKGKAFWRFWVDESLDGRTSSRATQRVAESYDQPHGSRNWAAVEAAQNESPGLDNSLSSHQKRTQNGFAAAGWQPGADRSGERSYQDGLSWSVFKKEYGEYLKTQGWLVPYWRQIWRR